MNKFILMHNAYTSTMVATAALAATIGAATTATAVDYPVLTSTGTTDASDVYHIQTFFNRSENWTSSDETTTVVPPSEEGASSFDYELTKELNGPLSPLNVFHSHTFTIKGGTWLEQRTGTVVVTNRFENEGLVLGDKATIKARMANSRHGDVTYEGKITITPSSSSNAATIWAGWTNGVDAASVLRLGGTLHGAGSLKTRTEHKGARVVIEAEAGDYTGTVNPNQVVSWTTFGCSVFNGIVAPWNGTAIGAERATSAVQINELRINKDGVVLIVPFANDGASCGCLSVTNSFTQSWTSGTVGSISVQLRGGFPAVGEYPILRLTPNCTGAFDSSKISFDSDLYVNNIRIPQAVPEKVSSTVRLAVRTDGDGARTLYVERVPLATVISMR